ncbi:MAG TPA: hypothetical protein VF794_10500 [Archangium sp.]|uniref:hypothetical protein n=1 Tax=Archangium sp. TaxID=1872627 RepID=UPI002ED87B5E
MNEQGATKSLDEAIVWLREAQQLGHYNSDTVRQLRVAAEAVRSLLAPTEPRTLDYIKSNREQLERRLINRSDSITPPTAKSYLSRAERLMRDFIAGVPLTRTQQQGPRRQRTSAKHHSDTDTTLPRIDSGNPEQLSYREHSLTLSNGRASIRLPDIITPADFKLITRVIEAHCPEMLFAWAGATTTNDETDRH